MQGLFRCDFRVPEEAIDVNRHMNNLAYLRWMQDIAMMHSAAVGWTLERYRRTKTSWVVRSHFIEYLRPALEGDEISLLTWVAGFTERSSPRKYLFRRKRDGVILARAETLWVFVDGSSGRPRRIAEEVAAAFDVVAAEEADVVASLSDDVP